MSNQYEIKTLNDVFKVPVEKRGQMFTEIERAYAMAEMICLTYKARLPKWLHWLCVPRMKKFTWIDDGKQEFNITVNGQLFIEGGV